MQKAEIVISSSEDEEIQPEVISYQREKNGIYITKDDIIKTPNLQYHALLYYKLKQYKRDNYSPKKAQELKDLFIFNTQEQQKLTNKEKFLNQVNNLRDKQVLKLFKLQQKFPHIYGHFSENISNESQENQQKETDYTKMTYHQLFNQQISKNTFKETNNFINNIHKLRDSFLKEKIEIITTVDKELLAEKQNIDHKALQQQFNTYQIQRLNEQEKIKKQKQQQKQFYIDLHQKTENPLKYQINQTLENEQNIENSVKQYHVKKDLQSIGDKEKQIIFQNYTLLLKKFIIENTVANTVIQENFQNQEEQKIFKKWIEEQQISNIEILKNLWTTDKIQISQEQQESLTETQKNQILQFKKTFKTLSYEFFSKYVTSYIMTSLNQFGKVNLFYLPCFIKGLQNPDKFTLNINEL